MARRRKTLNCRCCRDGCTCNTCNYVVVLKFCGTRGVADQYEIYFQGELVTTITDDATADGCRVFVIGNVADVCENVVTNLETTYGESAVTVIQSMDMDDDVSSCEVTLEVLPLDGGSVHDLDYLVYKVCHESAPGSSMGALLSLTYP